MPSSASPRPTYTTIPIAGADVISRSLQNLTSSFSLLRPFPEFLAAAEIAVPPSFPSANSRLRKNLRYFRLNYAVVVLSCALLALLFFRSPFSLLLVSAVFFLWLVLYFFREDPLLVWGRHVTDTCVFLGLVAVSVVAVWSTGSFGTLVCAAGVGVLIVAVHGILRNDEGLFLDETEAASKGLIASEANPNPISGHLR